MTYETCVACGGQPNGWIDGFALCKEHYREVEAIEEKKAEERALVRREALRAEFRRRYPEIVTK